MRAQKDELRSSLKARLKENRPFLARKSEHICQHIQKHPFWTCSTNIALFAPLPSEPDLLPLCKTQGKRFIFPKISGQNLSWFVVDDPLTQLAPCSEGNLRLLEPNTSMQLQLSEIQLLLVPGLGFTKSGFRLGRGGGFYDRTLSLKTDATKAMGVCFDFQLCEQLPIEAHDLPVDGLFHA